MPTRAIRTEADLERFITHLRHKRLPLSVTVTDGRVRSVHQNRLQRLWCNEVADQSGDVTAEEVRGQCKLWFGVPILRAENEEFRAAYDRAVRPLDYETKIALMMEPLDFPVTRLMKVDQKVRYLNAIYNHFSAQGLELTQPDPEMRAVA